MTQLKVKLNIFIIKLIEKIQESIDDLLDEIPSNKIHKKIEKNKTNKNIIPINKRKKPILKK